MSWDKLTKEDRESIHDLVNNLTSRHGLTLQESDELRRDVFQITNAHISSTWRGKKPYQAPPL